MGLLEAASLLYCDCGDNLCGIERIKKEIQKKAFKLGDIKR